MYEGLIILAKMSQLVAIGLQLGKRFAKRAGSPSEPSKRVHTGI